MAQKIKCRYCDTEFDLEELAKSDRGAASADLKQGVTARASSRLFYQNQ